MSALKARVFDAIKRAGPAGIETTDLFDLIFAPRGASRCCMKTHIWQLNEIIADSGHRITRRGGTAYRLIKISTTRSMKAAC